MHLFARALAPCFALALALPAAAQESTDLAHTDVSLSLGIIVPGLSLEAGRRFESGLRIEGGVGTLLVATGARLGAGYVFTPFQKGDFRLEAPLILGAMGWYCTFCSHDEEAHNEEGADDDDRDVQLGGHALAGLDLLWGEAEGVGLLVSLRAGVMAVQSTDPDAGSIRVYPTGQLAVGVAF